MFIRPLLLGLLLLLGIACTTALGEAGPEGQRDAPTPFPTSAMATPDTFTQLYDVARAELIASSPDVKANTLRVMALEEQVGRLRQELNQVIQKQRLAGSGNSHTHANDHSHDRYMDLSHSHLPDHDHNRYGDDYGHTHANDHSHGYGY